MFLVAGRPRHVPGVGYPIRHPRPVTAEGMLGRLGQQRFDGRQDRLTTSGSSARMMSGDLPGRCVWVALGGTPNHLGDEPTSLVSPSRTTREDGR